MPTFDQAAIDQDSAAPTGVVVAAFYKFVAVDDPTALQDLVQQICGRNDIRGTILVAHEGLNATVSGSKAGIDAFVGVLRADTRFHDLFVKLSKTRSHPFRRLKVKIKPEIVTFGAPTGPGLEMARVVDPPDWNALISDENVLLIDARNDYEVEIGTFPGARNPQTRVFSEFRDYVARELGGDRDRKIAMFCTGGIRCEKAGAYLIANGFTNVHQLRGGILNYLEHISPTESLWRGDCFVFDDRVALQHGVTQGRHRLCSRCGCPVKIEDALVNWPVCQPCDGKLTRRAPKE